MSDCNSNRHVCPVGFSKRYPLILLALIWIGVTQAGCQRPVQPEGPTAYELAMDEDLDALWHTALAVLRKVDFRPDMQDRATGVISCVPTTSMQWHEPWRQDVVTGFGLLESSISTIQRRAIVRFVKGERWSIEVQIDVYRLSRSETQITSASSVLHGFSGSVPTVEGVASDEAANDYWVYLGRDGALEMRLINRILDEAGAAWVEDVAPEQG